MRTFVLLVPLVFCNACSSSSSPMPGGPSADAGLARSEWCPKRASALCEQRAACCDAAGIAPDKATCLANEISVCEKSGKYDDDAGSVYDALAAALCLPHVTDGIDCGPSNVDPTYACAAVFRGTLDVGAPCSRSSECKGRLDAFTECLGPEGARTCRLQHLHAVGDACEASQRNICGVDYHCDVETEGSHDGVCIAKRREGEPCRTETSEMCVAGLFCGGDVCMPPGPAGAACDRWAAGSCAAPAHCDGLTAECTPPVPLGGACYLKGSFKTEPQDACGPDAYCSSTECVPRRRTGEFCVERNECVGYCVESTCKDSPPTMSDVRCSGGGVY